MQKRASGKLEMSVSGRVCNSFSRIDIHELIKRTFSKNGGLDLLLDGLTIEYLERSRTRLPSSHLMHTSPVIGCKDR